MASMATKRADMLRTGTIPFVVWVLRSDGEWRIYSHTTDFNQAAADSNYLRWQGCRVEVW